LQFAFTPQELLRQEQQSISPSQLPPLPQHRPLLMVGHGSRSSEGRQNVIDFAQQYHQLDPSRPVVPCFLELTEPSIQDGVDRCVEQGYNQLSVLPVLLFAARHNKFDVTNELDRARLRHPQVQFHYGRHFGLAPAILQLWRDRLALLDQPLNNPQGISRAETVLLFVGRGASDPDANGDVFKLARMVWEGSGYDTTEVCFIGITHPRMEEGLRRARLYSPKRIVVLPYFLFTGVLMEKVFAIAQEHQAAHPGIETLCLPEMGLHPRLFEVLRQRELETQLGQVQMNCEMCKFRIAAAEQLGTGHSHPGHGHDHGHGHGHDHGSSHDHSSHDHSSHDHSSHDQGSAHNHGILSPDYFAKPEEYHERAWQVP
jgi:sirohydrochlorin cobaltochelatase